MNEKNEKHSIWVIRSSNSKNLGILKQGLCASPFSFLRKRTNVAFHLSISSFFAACVQVDFQRQLFHPVFRGSTQNTWKCSDFKEALMADMMKFPV